MKSSSEHEDKRRQFSDFADRYILPFTASSDQSRSLHEASREALRSSGFLGGFVPTNLGGLGMDQVAYGLLTGEVGRACSSARTLMTVHGLVLTALLRWGNPEQKQSLLRDLAAAKTLAAFALSEPQVGSDAAALQTTISHDGDNLILNGQKSWVSFGQTADIFLVFGRAQNGIAAALVPKDSPGFSRIPVQTMVGTRAAMMAHLHFEDCRIPADFQIGRPGFGLSHIAASALDFGRYSVAWGAVGIADAAFSACHRHTGERQQFSTPLRNHPLMRSRLTKMAVQARASRLYCLEAGRLRDESAESALAETMMAKYFASKTAVYCANEAIQIHGATGLLEETGMERLLRDAKVTEIIEGSSDLIELMIGDLNFGVPH